MDKKKVGSFISAVAAIMGDFDLYGGYPKYTMPVEKDKPLFSKEEREKLKALEGKEKKKYVKELQAKYAKLKRG